jgi:hypothetical protein
MLHVDASHGAQWQDFPGVRDTLAPDECDAHEIPWARFKECNDFPIFAIWRKINSSTAH